MLHHGASLLPFFFLPLFLLFHFVSGTSQTWSWFLPDLLDIPASVDLLNPFTRHPAHYDPHPYPGSRYGSIMIKDEPNHNMYLFGGDLPDYGLLSDLFRVSLDAGVSQELFGYGVTNWECLSTGLQNGFWSFGELENPQWPGARRFSQGVMLNDNDMYIFGGEGLTTNHTFMFYGWLNDLWKYSVVTGLWNFIPLSDSNMTGNWGVVVNGTIHPGARCEHLVWTLNDKFYVLGGKSCTEFGCSTMFIDSYVWEYDPTIGPNGEWQFYSYGNTPDRYSATGWTFQNSFYLYGGVDDFWVYSSLWKFDMMSSPEWEMLLEGGLNYANAPYFPGFRASATACAVQDVVTGSGTNYTFLFAGFDYSQNEPYGDLWRLNMDTLEWEFFDIPGTRSLSSDVPFLNSFTLGEVNFPGTRQYHSMVCDQELAMIYVHGGQDPKWSPEEAIFGALWYLPSIFCPMCNHHGNCTTDRCVCDLGYIGTYCERVTCNGLDAGACSEIGECIGLDTCSCPEGFTNETATCDDPICYGLAASESEVCSGNGDCVAPNDCRCSGDFVGEKCFVGATSNILEWLKDNKWYVIGGVAGVILVVCVLVVALVFGIAICCSIRKNAEGEIESESSKQDAELHDVLDQQTYTAEKLRAERHLRDRRMSHDRHLRGAHRRTNSHDAGSESIRIVRRDASASNLTRLKRSDSFDDQMSLRRVAVNKSRNRRLSARDEDDDPFKIAQEDEFGWEWKKGPEKQEKKEDQTREGRSHSREHHHRRRHHSGSGSRERRHGSGSRERSGQHGSGSRERRHSRHGSGSQERRHSRHGSGSRERGHSQHGSGSRERRHSRRTHSKEHSQADQV